MLATFEKVVKFPKTNWSFHHSHVLFMQGIVEHIHIHIHIQRLILHHQVIVVEHRVVHFVTLMVVFRRVSFTTYLLKLVIIIIITIIINIIIIIIIHLLELTIVVNSCLFFGDCPLILLVVPLFIPVELVVLVELYKYASIRILSELFTIHWLPTVHHHQI